MTEVVQADPDALAEVASDFQQQSETVGEMVQAVQTAMNRLQPDWVGLGSDAFFGFPRPVCCVLYFSRSIYSNSNFGPNAHHSHGFGRLLCSQSFFRCVSSIFFRNFGLVFTSIRFPHYKSNNRIYPWKKFG